MTTRRDEILRATSEAARIYGLFPVGQRTSFDIVAAVTGLEVPLLFRPLGSLWGATITIDADTRGILVTTKLDVHVQRFTLAHELGHVLLGHGTSLDRAETIGLLRWPSRKGVRPRPTPEIAADTFASELLAARSLLLANAQRHQWKSEDLIVPSNVYQLSLRIGLSFQATCWALASQRAISLSAAESLQARPIKELKRAIAGDQIIDPWADVWRVTENDSGSVVEAGPGDLFAVELTEKASAGYLWDLIDPGPYSRILRERSDLAAPYGGPSRRVTLLTFTEPGRHRLVFAHRRPWSKEELAHIDIEINNVGKEEAGFARRTREQALAAIGA